MTLPTRPNAIFSTLQGTQNPDTKPTLQRAKNANAPSPPTTQQTESLSTSSQTSARHHCLTLDMAAITAKNIIKFQQTLLNWYDTDGRHFPWRNKRLTQYQIIIAETLLQRTKAETVSKFYAQFIKDFPNWKNLAHADTAAIELYLKPIGLYRQRAKRLKNLAVEMVKRKGKLPHDRKDLESIPFIGQYIANAIELIIHNQPSPLVDVNMARLLERYFGERKMADIRYDPYLQKLSYKVVDHSKAKEINWAILDYAALICSKRAPKCNICIFSQNCNYFSNV